MMHHDPANWTFQQWLTLLLFPFCGGLISFYQHHKKRMYCKDARPFNMIEFIAEISTSSCVGVAVGFFLVPIDIESAWIYAIVGFSGYSANRILFLSQNIAEYKLISWSGVNKDDFNNILKTHGQDDLDKLDSLESLESDGVCLPVWQAFYLIEQGIAMRHMLWPKNQFVSMPTTGKIHLKAENLWSEPNAAFGRTQPDQLVLILPSISIKMPNGQILPGWTPSVQDMSIPGWIRVSDTEITGIAQQSPTTEGHTDQTEAQSD
jgi:hypothetical protein